jgi:hypothetical protein
VGEVLDWLKAHAAPLMLQVCHAACSPWCMSRDRGLQGSHSLTLTVVSHSDLLRSIALLLAQKLIDVGYFRVVWGNSKAPLQQHDALLRFHDDERDISMLNCRCSVLH